MTSTPRIFTLIVAAGVGRRAGGELPKQYAPIGGNPMLAHSVTAFATHPAMAGVMVVIHAGHEGYYAESISSLSPRFHNGVYLTSSLQEDGPRHEAGVTGESKLLPAVIGGAERNDSVRAGLAALAQHKPDYVLIHDAARPFLSHGMIDRIIDALTPETGVVPALAVADTVRRLDGQHWGDIPRDGLMRIQTPQAFPFAKLREVVTGHRSPATPTDDAAIWLAAGNKLAYVAGDEDLRKVTTAEDIHWANSRATSCRTAVGLGYDVHALVPGEGVIRLGGIDIAHDKKLDGHSDADVVLHAIVDALLGTIAAGDIGSHFPPTDARWKGANSAIFLEEARAQVAARGGEISHLDITIIGEKPKISSQREAMRTSIASMLHLPLSRVSVKATTTEKLGFEGREEGIACHAIATVSLPMEVL